MTAQTSYSIRMSLPYAGVLYDGGPHDVITMVNAEASAEMAFGRAVAFKGSGTDDLAAIIPAADTARLAGIVLHSHNYAATVQTGTTGVKAGERLSVLRKGRVYAISEDGCVPGDRLWVRVVAGGDPEFLGGLNNADDSTDMIDATSIGVWQSTASAGGVAVLEVDFTAKPVP